MTTLKTTQEAKELLTSKGFKAIVETSIDTDWERVFIIVEGFYFEVFSTENTEHSFTAADKCFVSSESLIQVSTKIKEARESQAIAAKKAYEASLVNSCSIQDEF